MSPLLHLLRLSPLLLSTATLTYAHDHDLFFRTFLHPSHPSSSSLNALIPAWIKAYMPRAGATIFVLYPSTFLLALANVYYSYSGAEKRYYAIGALFTLAHFLFAKRALALLIGMRDAGGEREGDKSAKEAMGEWVRVNVVRTLGVDVPAWGCYLAAVLFADG